MGHILPVPKPVAGCLLAGSWQKQHAAWYLARLDSYRAGGREVCGSEVRKGHMRSTTRARLALRAIAATLGVALLLGNTALAVPAPSPSPSPTPAPATAAPATTLPGVPSTDQYRSQITSKQAELNALKQQLDQLDIQSEMAAEEYNAAQSRLTTITAQLQSTQQDLSNAKLAYEVQSQLLQNRAREVYRDGKFGSVQILLESHSISDFVSRVKFLAMIAGQDADVAAQLAAQRDQIQTTANRLQQDKDSAESLQFQLKAKKIEIQLRIQDRQEMLDHAQKDLVAMLQTESEHMRADQASLLKDIMSGSSQTGIIVQPGSPVETALAYHGVPYLWGGASPAAFDCSGLIMYAFAQHGVLLPHYSRAQFQLGEPIDVASLQPGDVVFFGAPVHHVGMYLGGGYYLHAPKTGDFVKISLLADRSDFAGARRYAWQPRLQPIAGLDLIPGNTDHSHGVSLSSLTR